MRWFAVIDTGLRTLRSVDGCSLAPVSSTLLRLCITEQRSLTELGPLNLPVCKDLLLHCNGLEALGDLSGCPRVQRLWVWSNRLTTLRGVGALAELRELWVQDNRLSGLNGVECLSALQALSTAQNPISTLASLDKLAHLPQLRSLSFRDPHFADCPVVASRSYRGLVATALPHLRQLDGRTISGPERDDTVHTMASKSAAFAADAGSRLAAFQARLSELRASRAAQAAAASEAHRSLSDALGSLQTAVGAGLVAVRAEADRQGRVRKAAGERAHSRLQRLQRAVQHWHGAREAQEAARREARAVVMQSLSLLGKIAAATATAVASIPVASGGHAVAHEVSPHSPEHKAVAEALAAEGAPSSRWVAAAFKVTRPGLAVAPAAAGLEGTARGGKARQWWVVGSRSSLLAAVLPGASCGSVLACTSLADLLELTLRLPQPQLTEVLGLSGGSNEREAELLRVGGVLCMPVLCVRELAFDAVLNAAQRLDASSAAAASPSPEETVAALMGAQESEHDAVWCQTHSGACAAWTRRADWWAMNGRDTLPIVQPEALAELRLCLSAAGDDDAAPLERAAQVLGLAPRGGITTARLLAGAMSEATAAARAVLVAQASARTPRAAPPTAADALAACESACSALAQPEEVRQRAAEGTAAITREFVLAVAAGRDPDDEAAAVAARTQARAADAQALAARREVGAVKHAQDQAVRAAASAV
jgi:hypothetical protein